MTVAELNLTPAEKLRLVQELWDDLASNPDDVPLHDWQLEELERRKARLLANPQSGLSWHEVKRRILGKCDGLTTSAPAAGRTRRLP